MWEWLKDKLGLGGSSQKPTRAKRDPYAEGNRPCPQCNGRHGHDVTVCPQTGRRIPEPVQASTANWALITAGVLLLTAGVVAAGGAGTVGGVIAGGVRVVGGLLTGAAAQPATVVGVGLVAAGSAGSASAMSPASGTSLGSANPSLPANATTWVRTGPFLSSDAGDLDVTGNSVSYTTAYEGISWTNTLTWDTLPPESLVVGQDVTLKMSATTEQGGASIGGWWNSNCYEHGSWKGDNSAGSATNYRISGGPHNVAEVTFKFDPPPPPSVPDPEDAGDYIQLSAGNDPVPGRWVLVTYKYVPAN